MIIIIIKYKLNKILNSRTGRFLIDSISQRKTLSNNLVSFYYYKNICRTLIDVVQTVLKDLLTIRNQ